MSRSKNSPGEDPMLVALKRLAANPPLLRVVLCLVLLVLGQVIVIGPLGSSLTESRDALALAETQLADAEAAHTLHEQLQALAEHAEGSTHTSGWQEWMLGQVGAAGIELLSFEPMGTSDSRGFKLLEFELSARAPSFAAAVDLINRLERGDRLLRFTKLRLADADGRLAVSATVLGLVDETTRQQGGDDA